LPFAINQGRGEKIRHREWRPPWRDYTEAEGGRTGILLDALDLDA